MLTRPFVCKWLLTSIRSVISLVRISSFQPLTRGSRGRCTAVRSTTCLRTASEPDPQSTGLYHEQIKQSVAPAPATELSKSLRRSSLFRTRGHDAQHQPHLKGALCPIYCKRSSPFENDQDSEHSLTWQWPGAADLSRCLALQVRQAPSDEAHNTLYAHSSRNNTQKQGTF